MEIIFGELECTTREVNFWELLRQDVLQVGRISCQPTNIIKALKVCHVCLRGCRS